MGSITTLIRDAYEFHRTFVLKRQLHQSNYNHYLVIFDYIEGIGDDVPDPPDHINKYLVRTIDMDLVTDNKDVLFIYSKMCKIALMTFLLPHEPDGMTDAQISESGTFPWPQSIEFAGFLDFLFDRAEYIDSYFSKLSQSQKLAIRERVAKESHRISTSETHKASLADLFIREFIKLRAGR